MPSSSRPDDDREGVPDSPLDDLFVVGAKFHEPSAKEREAAAREAARRAKQEEKERQKRVKHTREVLEGHRGSEARARFGHMSGAYDRRTALIGFASMAALAVVLSMTIWK